MIPMKEFFKNKNNFNFEIAPNGENIAFLKNYKNKINIWIRNSKTNKEKVITTQQKRNIYSYFWKGNEQIVYFQDKDGDENHHAFIINIKTKKIKDLTPYKKVKVVSAITLNKSVLLQNKKEYENKIILVHNKRDKSAFDWVLKDINSLKEKIIWKGSIQTSVGFFDEDDMKIKYVIEIHQGGSTYYEKNINGNKKLLKVSSKDYFEIVEYNSSKNKIYALSNIGKDKIGLYEMDLNLNLDTQKLIFEHKNVDLEDALIHPITRKLIGITYEDDKKIIDYFDKEFAKKQKLVEKNIKQKFPDEKNVIITFQENFYNPNIFIIDTVSSDKENSEYLWINKNLNLLSEKNKYLNPKNLAQTKYINYKARDGLTIHAYLTLPKNKKGPMPIIIHPHGGPWVRDTWGYNSEVQYLVNRGFGVFQPNFRISTGYGKNHFIKGWKQWGLSCQDDITDGTKWLIKKGYTKIGMIGIYGASYGGYATLMGIIKEPNLYSAAIDYVGVSDLFSFWDGFPPYWKTKGNIFEEAMGNPYENEKLSKKISPIYHIDKIKTPLMIVQGANDPRVPQKQSDLIYNKLKNNGVDVEYILKKDEGHGFMNQENKFELYEKIIIFFNKYLNKK